MPGSRDLDELSHAHWHGQYLYTNSEYERMRRKYRFLYRRLLPADRQGRVLDVGCGGGNFLHYLRSEGFTRLTGVDSDSRAVAICRERVTDGAVVGDAIEFLRGHAGAFDLVVCNHVIEHLSRERSMELAAAIYDALAAGGTAIVATPNAMTPWTGYHCFDDLTHDHLYTSGSLRETLSAAGFTAIEIHPEGPVPYDLLTAVRYALWKVREAGLRFLFAVDVGIGRARRTEIIVTQGLIGIGRKLIV